MVNYLNLNRKLYEQFTRNNNEMYRAFPENGFFSNLCTVEQIRIVLIKRMYNEINIFMETSAVAEK